MKQYCRYCANAFDYNGEGEDFLCNAKAPCGNNGAGAFYDASKAKRINKCPHFEFCPNDVFSSLDENGNYRQYKPRAKKDFEQLKMEFEVYPYVDSALEDRYYSYKKLTDLLNKPCQVVIASHEEVKKARDEALFSMLTKKA